jgi:hypothetical protein
MGHYAKVEDGIVTQVIVADGPEWCEQNLCGEWIQTSYNTYAGVHSEGKFPIHKNYAGIGYTFDGIGFAAPQPYPSWIKNTESYVWEAPTPMPTDGKRYEWVEADLAWVEITETPAI